MSGPLPERANGFAKNSLEAMKKMRAGFTLFSGTSKPTLASFAGNALLMVPSSAAAQPYCAFRLPVLQRFEVDGVAGLDDRARRRSAEQMRIRVGLLVGVDGDRRCERDDDLRNAEKTGE
jgi:hypothetical protein